MLFILMVMTSCYNPLTNLVKRPFVSDVISYKSNKTMIYNGKEVMNQDFITIKDFSNNTSVLQDLEGKELNRLEKGKLFVNKAEMPYQNDRLARILYEIQLNTIIELEGLLKIVDYKEVKREVKKDLVKIHFEEGYLVYNIRTKTLLELKDKFIFKHQEQDIEIESSINIKYNEIKGRRIISYMNMQFKSSTEDLIMEEKVKE